MPGIDSSRASTICRKVGEARIELSGRRTRSMRSTPKDAAGTPGMYPANPETTTKASNLDHPQRTKTDHVKVFNNVLVLV